MRQIVRNLRNNEGFGRLLKKNPSAAIADILNSNDPIKPREQLKSLIDFASSLEHMEKTRSSFG